MIFAVFIRTPPPIRVTPRIFNEHSISRLKEFLFHVRVLRNFREKDPLRHLKLYVVPIFKVLIFVGIRKFHRIVR